jgi:hypothetical protein
MATPKVKMPLQPQDVATALGIPSTTEIISMFVTNDPLSITLILASDDDFDALYAEDGGFYPDLSYKTVAKDFFTS